MEKGSTEDEMVGWHHPLSGHEFEQTVGDSEGQGSLSGYSPCDPKRIGHDLVTKKQQLPNTFGFLNYPKQNCFGD